MKIKEIVTTIADLEGKKDNDSIGNIREIVAIISDMIFANPEILKSLLKNGKRRAKK